MTQETTLTDGGPVTEDHRDIDPVSGQQKGYVVLSEAERAKGFVRPIRYSYVHVGLPAPKGELRDLTEEEHARYGGKFGYVKFEPYGPDRAPVTGKFWTQKELDKLGAGCGVMTTMSTKIAETYARDPKFYGGTFCAGCKAHFAVGEYGEFVWVDTNIRVGS
jgi:hypothetical protein